MGGRVEQVDPGQHTAGHGSRAGVDGLVHDPRLAPSGEGGVGRGTKLSGRVIAEGDAVRAPVGLARSGRLAHDRRHPDDVGQQLLHVPLLAWCRVGVLLGANPTDHLVSVVEGLVEGIDELHSALRSV